MEKEKFLKLLQNEVVKFNSILSTENGEWIVKGFIDIYKNIYTITLDTKVVSKVIEILLIPAFEKFAKDNNLSLELPPQQNFYPDLTFICNETKQKFAVDIKSTMKDGNDKIKSMTLGAFTGYFRNRDSRKNTAYPYGEYKCHLVLGVVYSQVLNSANEKDIYSLDDIENIESVIKDFVFFVQPKYKIATDRPGSGNTKNIGAIADLNKLLKGEGKFSKLGEEVFDDYWMYYLTKDMAKEAGLTQPPYNNLISYKDYKTKNIGIIEANADEFKKYEAEEINDGEDN